MCVNYVFAFKIFHRIMMIIFLRENIIKLGDQESRMMMHMQALPCVCVRVHTPTHIKPLIWMLCILDKTKIPAGVNTFPLFSVYLGASISTARSCLAFLFSFPTSRNLSSLGFYTEYWLLQIKKKQNKTTQHAPECQTNRTVCFIRCRKCFWWLSGTNSTNPWQRVFFFFLNSGRISAANQSRRAEWQPGKRNTWINVSLLSKRSDGAALFAMALG